MAVHIDTVTKVMHPKQPAWRALEAHYKRIRDLHLRQLFLQDPSRGERMNVEGAGLYLDYSKNRITDQTLKLLIQLAEESGLQFRIDAMFRGERVNTTERRAALHIALRAPRGASIFVDGENVVPVVHATLGRMTSFCNRVRCGEWKGQSGKRIRNVINIATGGSDLGPAMFYEALKAYSDRSLTFRFVSNVDSADLWDAFRDCDPSETLFVMSPETFTTIDAITNVQTARAWLLDSFGGDQSSIRKHFVAVSTDIGEALKFGIDNAGIFELWDWVGRRYSVDSAIGLSTMLAIGPENFRAMLDGFHQMDMHFLTTPHQYNLPVLLGLFAVWYNKEDKATLHNYLLSDKFKESSANMLGTPFWTFMRDCTA